MRKIKIASSLLFIISVLIFGAYKLYEKKISDTTAPVITCDTEEISVSVDASEEDLLAGVAVKDNRTEDISNALVIESISLFTEENTRIITYAAIDEKGNVGRMERVLKYNDYQEPQFVLSEPMRYPVSRSIDILSGISAQSVLDGDLTDSIKYTLDSTINLMNPGIYQAEFRVMDSAGKVVYLPLQIEVFDPTEERIEVILSKYLIYLPLNAKFEPKDYFVGSDIDGKLSVKSNVKTNAEGVYEVEYLVTGKNSIGKSKLVVVVSDS